MNYSEYRDDYDFNNKVANIFNSGDKDVIDKLLVEEPNAAAYEYAYSSSKLFSEMCADRITSDYEIWSNRNKVINTYFRTYILPPCDEDRWRKDEKYRDEWSDLISKYMNEHGLWTAKFCSPDWYGAEEVEKIVMYYANRINTTPKEK